MLNPPRVTGCSQVCECAAACVCVCQSSFQRMQRPSAGLPGSASSPRDRWRLTERDWHLVEPSQEELAALSGGGKMGSASRGAWHCLKLEECRAFSSINSPAAAGKGLLQGGGRGVLQLEPCLPQQGWVSVSVLGQFWSK